MRSPGIWNHYGATVPSCLLHFQNNTAVFQPFPFGFSSLHWKFNQKQGFKFQMNWWYFDITSWICQAECFVWHGTRLQISRPTQLCAGQRIISAFLAALLNPLQWPHVRQPCSANVLIKKFRWANHRANEIIYSYWRSVQYNQVQYRVTVSIQNGSFDVLTSFDCIW